MVEEVFIQVGSDRDFLNTALFSAARGFETRGRFVTRATAEEIEAMEARPEVLVFGGVEVVRPYLARLGCEPDPFDYPEAMRNVLRRELRRARLDEIRKQYNEPGPPVFIKPVDHKAFTGHVVRRFRDLLRTVELDGDTEIYVSEYVRFLSEWRFYVERNKVVGVDHYKGDPLYFPNRFTPTAAIEQWADEAPAAYGVDFGVCPDGQTRLVEVNDMISLGSYGLDPAVYAGLIETRWDQLVSARSGT